ncbi:iron complex outermembrane receptor protein [Robbsia andropogonis]|uniref:TonB-dependent receptor domain-containing protein n=1 Tax=Robbsia andropogonis TaxID=28092 RepID=UPI003D24112B
MPLAVPLACFPSSKRRVSLLRDASISATAHILPRQHLQRAIQSMRHHTVHLGFAVATGCSADLVFAEDDRALHDGTTASTDHPALMHHAPARTPVLVTTSPPRRDGQTTLDPRLARQPVPASDGADYLSAVPGFAAVGNGGTNGDPVLRGLGGGRLSVLSNGTAIHGACGGRMDAPTAYLSPETFDYVHVIKGPGTVRWGPAALAGTVRFERKTVRFATPGLRFHGAILGGMYGRHDGLIDLAMGDQRGDARLIAFQTHADNYRDGDHRTIPSRWTKWQVDSMFNWYPTHTTRWTLEAGTGDGAVRYASRGMDGRKFQRDNVALSVTIDQIGERLRSASAQVSLTQIDHVMDNFSLRDPRTQTGGPAHAPGWQRYQLNASNPGRTLIGGRGELTWSLAPQWQLHTGIDGLLDRHTVRAAGSMPLAPSADDARAYAPDPSTLPRYRNAVQSRVGVFAQTEWRATSLDTVAAGARIDRAHALDLRQTTLKQGLPNRRHAWLPGGFVRWEHDLAATPITVFASLGHTRRFPDYWELFSSLNGPSGGINAFNGIQPEKATQIDVGLRYDDSNVVDRSVKAYTAHGHPGEIGGTDQGPIAPHGGYGRHAWLTAYVASVKDFILFDYAPDTQRIRNVDARLYGGEAGFSWPLSLRWRVDVSTALAMGDNRSDRRPLAQMPPLDTRIGLQYRDGPWSTGLLWRVVTSQHRWAKYQGTVAGQDFRASGGYGLLSLNASYAVSRIASLHVGIDNVFNKTYAEHLNRQGAAGFGFLGDMPFNNPGRLAWAKLIVDL